MQKLFFLRILPGAQATMGILGETAIIINTRPDSKRVPRKIFTEFPLGKDRKITMLGALIARLKETKIPIILAIPSGTERDYLEYSDNVHFYEGTYSDPLKRMSNAARRYGIKNIIRVCHDKIFIDEKLITRALQIYKNMEIDYLYSSFFIEGTGFEIIRSEALHLASSMHKDVEHISYAIKSITNNVYNWATPSSERSNVRLLADTYDDIKVLQKVFNRFKTKTLTTDIKDIVNFLLIHPEIATINASPQLTIYTCCFNGEKYIAECIESVVNQKNFNDYQYIIIDDNSTDESAEIIAKYVKFYDNITYIKNEKNIGLASSSNVALGMAKGKYITRLDADDYYSSKNSVIELIDAIRHSDMDAIYPANFFGSKGVIQTPEENHHIGGAIFNRRSMNDIKFTDGLRGYEGLDFFHRARNILKIGYLANPVFFYRQHAASMTKESKSKRDEIKKGITSDFKSKMGINRPNDFVC